MDIVSITQEVLIPGILGGVFIGGAIFLLGLGINLCLKLFNS